MFPIFSKYTTYDFVVLYGFSCLVICRLKGQFSKMRLCSSDIGEFNYLLQTFLAHIFLFFGLTVNYPSIVCLITAC